MLDAILPLVRDHERFLITTHLRPDGDALGSQLALGRFLQKLGKSVMMLNSDQPPYMLDWMPGADDVQVFEGTFEQHKAIAEAEVAFLLDTNAEDRLGTVGTKVRTCGATTVLVDHHLDPETWFDVPFVRSDAAAAAVLVYEILDAIDPDLIDAPIATALYTGIMTDTGSFRFSSVTPDLHRIIADILERGAIQPAPIHEQMFDRKSMPALRLLGRMLNRIRLRHHDQVAYSVVTQRMVEDTGASWDDKQGFVNYVLSIEGVKAALLFSETNDGAKISFRSEAGTHVDEWARSFGGGGHANASGAYVRRPSFEQAIEDVMDAAPRFLDLQDPAASENGLSSEDESYLQAMMDARSDSV